ncbi:hypothetical protein HDV06_004586 [Boothiomyces sp. JEL0866]|nr:hypothetical protein HDV06_004586 [Boothiomyces sp. JEL0866]
MDFLKTADPLFVLRQAFWGLSTYIAGSLVFDGIHYIFHVFQNSKSKLLRTLAYPHAVHHYFYNRKLKFNNSYRLLNVIFELPLELACQSLGFYGMYYLFKKDIQIETIWILFAISAVRTGVVMLSGGEDTNHVVVDQLGVDRVPLFVTLNYHALHHVYPEAYYGSMTKLFDWVIGASYSLKGKKVLVTGASGAFGGPMIEILKKEATAVYSVHYGSDWTYEDYSKLEELFKEVDILVLAHGSKVKDAMKANCDSFVTMIEMFRKIKQEQAPLVPPEVWAVGSEIEFHPAWGIKDLQIYKDSKCAYMKHARKYYDAPDILYRHIVPSAFDSKMGAAIISGTVAAKWAMFFIRRGCQYVPVTYTSFAYFHYFVFKFLVEKAK